MYELVEENRESLQQISPTVTMMGAVKIGSDTISTTSITGVSEDYFAMKGYEVAQGRGLQYVDMTDRKKVCVVGQYLNMAYFGGNAVGQTLKINGNTFTIVGVMAQKADELEEGGTDDCVFVPYSTAARLSCTGTITSYTITVQNTDQHLRGQDRGWKTSSIEIFSDDDAYTVISMAEMVEEMNSMVNMIIYILAGIAAISLVVGGIGIMNIMLVSVTERTREIGIRKALGAKESAIMRQFVIEAATTSALGGVLGIAAGLRTFRRGHCGDRQPHAGYPHHRQPQRGGGDHRLRRLRRHRHCLRLSCLPKRRPRSIPLTRCATTEFTLSLQIFHHRFRIVRYDVAKVRQRRELPAAGSERKSHSFKVSIRVHCLPGRLSESGRPTIPLRLTGAA